MAIGMIGALPLAESMALPWIGGRAVQPSAASSTARRHPPLRHRPDRRASTSAPPVPRRAPATLSGGNLQKALLAREIARDPKILLAAQPTRGIDVGATEFVHGQFLALRAKGGAVLLISEDLEELFQLSDRIAVMYGGRIVADMPVGRGDGRAHRPLHGRRRSSAA